MFERFKSIAFAVTFTALAAINFSAEARVHTDLSSSVKAMIERLEGNWVEHKAEAIPVNRGITLHPDHTLEVRTFRPALDEAGNEIACKVTWFGKITEASRTDIFGARPILAKGNDVYFFAYDVKSIILSPDQENENIDLCAEIVAEQNAILNSSQHKKYRARFPAYISTRFKSSKKFLMDIGLHGEQLPFEKTI